MHGEGKADGVCLQLVSEARKGGSFAYTEYRGAYIGNIVVLHTFSLGYIPRVLKGHYWPLLIRRRWEFANI